MRRCGGAEWAHWLAAQGHRRARGDRHAQARPPHPRGGRDARRGRRRRDRPRPRLRARADPAAAVDGGPGARLGRLVGRADRLQRGRPRPGGGRRLRRQDARSCAACAGRRGGHRVPARRRPRRARRLRRRPALERPRRPGAADGGGGGDPRPARAHERARDLPRPPAARARDRARDLQAALRPSRRQPPGARARHRPRARDEPEPRLRGCAERRARGHLRLALRRHRRGLRLPRAERALGAVPSRGGARHARRLADPRGLGRRARCLPDAAPHRHPLDLPDRLRPDRDRPGLRVRLLGLPGAEGAARGRLPHDRRQLEPGHDHDRPGLRRPHVHRAARHPGRRRRAPPRAAGRAAADARRPDRAQPRDRALRGGRSSRSSASSCSARAST